MKKITLQKTAPGDIEERSMAIIAQEMGPHHFTPAQLPIVKRCVHTSADFDYVKNLVFTPGAVEAGLEAIQAGCAVVTDTEMARSGVNKRVLSSFGGEAVCFMAREDVAKEAKERGVTRATVSMERAVRLSGPVILAVGNAPTALIRACELMEEKAFSPALVIGVPVGFVNVVESKELLRSVPCEHIAAMGRKGGSNIAAAIVNALLYTASQGRRE